MLLLRSTQSLQNRALFEREKMAKRCREKGEEDQRRGGRSVSPSKAHPCNMPLAKTVSCAAVFGKLRCRSCTATFAFLQSGCHFYHKLRCSKRKLLHRKIEKAVLQESGAFLPLSCGFQAPTFRLHVWVLLRRGVASKGAKRKRTSRESRLEKMGLWLAIRSGLATGIQNPRNPKFARKNSKITPRTPTRKRFLGKNKNTKILKENYFSTRAYF